MQRPCAAISMVFMATYMKQGLAWNRSRDGRLPRTSCASLPRVGRVAINRGIVVVATFEIGVGVSGPVGSWAVPGCIAGQQVGSSPWRVA
ncbi:unnamed protein product [Leptosia nina]|uniref:Uncharacterized protein n=1 Tax=Leptosia nina TaxID=320188 RepID=A0AAV1IVB5_9NEOP